MNKKLFLITNILFSLILISVSLAPQATWAGTPKQGENTQDLSRFETKGDDDLNYPRYHRYTVPGIGLIAGDELLTWYNAADGCLNSNYDGGVYKSFVYPLLIPHNAEIVNVTAYYKNDQDHNQTGAVVALYETYIMNGETKAVIYKPLTKKTKGLQEEIWQFLKTVDNLYYHYWLEFYFPKGVSHTSICQIMVSYRVESPYLPYNDIPDTNQP